MNYDEHILNNWVNCNILIKPVTVMGSSYEEYQLKYIYFLYILIAILNNIFLFKITKS